MEENKVTFDTMRHDPEVRAYIAEADRVLAAIGYTEHSFAHVGSVAERAGNLLAKLGYDEHTVELTRIAGYLHDIGNVVNRRDHAQSGALLARSILARMGMPYADVAAVVTAIGHHDESVAEPVTPIAAAIIIADKADVRRSRVRRSVSAHPETFDMHDRVNYSAVDSRVRVDLEKRDLWLDIEIDTGYSSVMEYFEAFLQRMLLCRRACEKLELTFRLDINNSILL